MHTNWIYCPEIGLHCTKICCNKINISWYTSLVVNRCLVLLQRFVSLEIRRHSTVTDIQQCLTHKLKALRSPLKVLATHSLQIPRLPRSCARSRDDKAVRFSTNHCYRQGHRPVCAGGCYPRPSEERKWNVMNFAGDMGARTEAYKRRNWREKCIISLAVCKIDSLIMAYKVT